MVEFGPRQRELIRAWTETIVESSSGSGYDFTSPTRNERVAQCVTEFTADPSEEAFESLWSRDILRDAVYAGAGGFLNNWNRPIAELGDFIASIRDADEYDDSWEREVPAFAETALWELYGRLHPESVPILNSVVRRALPQFGIPEPRDYDRARQAVTEFRQAYTSVNGRATAGTQHEVPVNEEIEQFLYVVDTHDESDLLEILDAGEPTYRTIAGWDAEATYGGPIELRELAGPLDSFTAGLNNDAYHEDRTEYWGGNHWESWKQTYRDYLTTQVLPEYQLTSLTADDIEPLIDALDVSKDISSVVPIYLLGGQWRPWQQFKDISQEDPEQAATILSHLLDEDDSLVRRLGAFNDFYHAVSDSGSIRMSLATMLLMFVYPEQYVMYRWGKFSAFFDAHSDYEVPTGYNPSHYVLMNDACRRLKDDLNTHVEHPVTMLDVHTFIWIWESVET